MNDATGDEDNIAYDEDEEDEDADVEDEAAMGIGTMQVHDMHLGDSTPAAGPPKPAEAAAAAAPAAAAADGSASARYALKCLFSRLKAITIPAFCHICNKHTCMLCI